MRTVQHGQSPIGLFSISNRDNLYLLVPLINNIEYSIIAGSYSETFAAMKLFGIAGERMTVMILSCIFAGKFSSSFSADFFR
jgi:hypothetical protein